jgi:uncharacterized membrane protein (DUF4010 family)
MRAVLAFLGIVCLLGGITSAVEGQWGTAAAWAFGFWLCAGWFAAASVAAAAEIDEEDES